MRYNTFILFGAPGSGKGTQGKTLGTIPRFYHCPCGDVFRSIDTRTKDGKAFLEYSSKGQLVPDDITVELWKEAIDAAVDAHKFKPDIDILVLDGIPRNVNQAKIMRELIDVEKVFHLACPDRETLFQRLKKRAPKDNRLDDANEEVSQRRLEIHEAESKPVLAHDPTDCISAVDAMQRPARSRTAAAGRGPETRGPTSGTGRAGGRPARTRAKTPGAADPQSAARPPARGRSAAGCAAGATRRSRSTRPTSRGRDGGQRG